MLINCLAFYTYLKILKRFSLWPLQRLLLEKGIPLPSLSIKLQQSYFQLLKQDQELIMIYCEITIAYPNRKETHFYLQQIKSLGDKKKPFSDEGLVEFSGIILKQSSQQKGNNKFSILMRICASSLEQNRIILKTLISTAFYVLNSRIERKIKKSKLTMKLITPKKFMKPLKSLKQIESSFNKQDILNFLKNCNKNARQLSMTHPLYMVYHYSHILKLYYNSKQVTDLYELLDTIAPNVTEQKKLIDLKRSFISYELKKTKKIKKNQQDQVKKQKKVQKLIIQTHIKEGHNQNKKLLLVTFKQNIIQKINHAIQVQKLQNERNSYKSILEKQIQNLTKIFQKWTKLYLQIDLLKQQPESVYWKDIQKEKVYQAYSKHYQMTKNRLTANKHSNMDVIQHEQNTHKQYF